jgi:hypothetical protein
MLRIADIQLVLSPSPNIFQPKLKAVRQLAQVERS